LLIARFLASRKVCIPVESMKVRSWRSRMIVETPFPSKGGQLLAQDRSGCQVEIAAQRNAYNTILLLRPGFQQRIAAPWRAPS
jgi:hypothetical protein